MTELFILQLLLSFIVAGIWTATAIEVAERTGTKLGGWLVLLPSKVAISLFFIGGTQTAAFAAQAAHIIPFAMAIDIFSLLVFLLLSKKKGMLPFAAALVAWAILSLLLGMSGYSDMLAGTLIYAASAIAIFHFLGSKLHIASYAGRKSKPKSISDFVGRAAFIGAFVAIAIVLAAFSGPVWGGIFAAFPAIIFSTLYVVSKNDGMAFARSMGKMMVLSSVNVVLYAILVAFAYPALGVVWGTIISYSAIIVFALFISRAITKP